MLGFLALLALASAQEAWDASLVLHSQEVADLYDARCLDGSRGGFYFRPASSPSAATKWKLHFMGGGWCSGDRDCLSRSKSLLGSSTFWTPTLSKLWPPEFAGFYGLMGANSTAVNPFGGAEAELRRGAHPCPRRPLSRRPLPPCRRF